MRFSYLVLGAVVAFLIWGACSTKHEELAVEEAKAALIQATTDVK